MSYGIRWYTWRAFHAYIDIQALQISLLGGRIFFKDIRYHAHNVTFHVHSGYITWYYWFRKVREAEVFSTDPPSRKDSRSGDSSPASTSKSLNREEKGGSHGTDRSRKLLPCRLQVQVEGVQIFVYNRSPAYDAIVESMMRNEKRQSATSESTAGETRRKVAQEARSVLDSVRTALWQTRSSDENEDATSPVESEKRVRHGNSVTEKPALPIYLHAFPIEVHCKTAAAVLGNDNTKSILTAKIDGANGVFDAGHAPSPLDVYKQIIDFEFDHPVITMKPNLDYKETQLATAARIKSGAPDPYAKERKRTRLWNKLKIFSNGSAKSSASIRAGSFDGTRDASVPAFQPDAPNTEKWKGLTRYLDDKFYDEHDEWDPIEYARSSTLVDCPQIGMTFQWDIPGKVPPRDRFVDDVPTPATEDINGSSPPEYAMELRVHGGSVVYGPWTDRQRNNFQYIFFPPNYSSAVPARNLLPGDTRFSSVFKIFVTVEAETIVRIPMRESSKDWRWKGRAEAVVAQKSKEDKTKSRGRRRAFWRQRDKGTTGPTVRPFGWLDIKVAPDSTVTYVMDMVARETGFRSKVDADIRSLEMTSSVNHGLLWRSGALTLMCDMPLPLGWNSLREWYFNVTNDDLELFILRDHLFLITDLINDWSSGPLPEFYTFTPFRYLLDVRFRNFKLFLNSNESNIINNPADLDDNQFIILFGKSLEGHVTIPIDVFRPVKNEVFFDVLMHDLGLNMCLNSRNTVSAFTGRKDVAILDEATLKGSHAYYSQTASGLTDHLTFFINGKRLTLIMFGFFCRHLVKLKENYFGEHLHFRTLEEYQELSRGQQLSADGDAKAQQAKQSNELDVILCITAEDVQAQLPANMYNATDYVQAELPFATVDLRITSYYMDLQINFSPVTLSHNHSLRSQDSPQVGGSRTEIFVNSATVVGHRLFGLPPTEPAYVCHWDVDIGNVSGECSSIFLDKLVRAIKCFAFSLDDDENATPLIPLPTIYDITFLRVHTHMLKIWVHVQADAFLLETDPISVEMNDWAGQTFSQRLRVVVPDVKLACLDAASANRHRARDSVHVVETHALVQTSAVLSMLKREADFTTKRAKQQQHLIEQDTRTQRTPFLVLPLQSELRSSGNFDEPPALLFPPFPAPLHGVPMPTIEASVKGSDPSIISLSAKEAPTASLNKVDQTSLRSKSSSIADSIWRGRLQQHEATKVTSDHASKQWVPFPDEEREKQGLPPSSVAFSSSIGPPYFPLHAVEPDTSDMPSYPQIDPSIRRATASPGLEDGFETNLDEDLTHMSFIVDIQPGIRGFCKPQAVVAVANLVDVLLPKDPEAVLDAFQISVMTELLDLEKKKHGSSQSIEVSLKLPSVAFRVFNEFKNENVTGDNYSGVDQYDLTLSQLALIARHRMYPEDHSQDITDLVHCTLDALQLMAKEKSPDVTKEEVAVRARVDEMLVWLSLSTSNAVNVSFRDFEFATGSRRVDYLASLVYRTALLANDYTRTFVRLQSDQSRRLQYLAYNLTMATQDVPDPPFLTRGWFAVRAMSGHLRNHDSFKIISRLRYIYRSISENERQGLIKDCLSGHLIYPANAESIVMNSWDQWRTWDLAHVRKSYAMKHIYGLEAGTAVPSIRHSPKPLQFEFRSASLKLVVDPGRHQSEISMLVPVITLDVTPPSPPSGLMLIPTLTPTRKVIIQIGLQAFILSLKWQITELIESTLLLFQDGERLEKIQSVTTGLPASTKPSQLGECLEAQGVLAIDSAVIGIETLNLKALLVSKGLKVSALGENGPTTGHSGSILVHSSVARSEFHSRSRCLLRARAESPYLYGSQTRPENQSESPSALQFTGASKKISIEGREEILGVIETVDSIIRDEVAYVKGRLLPSIQAMIAKTPQKSSALAFPKLTLALLMDSFRLDLALLQSLKYTMSGSLGRLSVTPNLEHGPDLDLNFDFGEHFHDLTSKAHRDLHVISALKLPPINGHVKVGRIREAISVSASTIIETIVVDASAVHGILNTFQRPEVSNTFKALEKDVDTIKDRLSLMFPESQDPPRTLSSTHSPPILYDVDLVLAGIKVHADAPGKLPDASVASLALGLNCVRFKVFNVVDDGETVLPLPEIHAQLRQLFVELTVADPKGKRSCGNLAMSATIDCTLRKTRKGERRNYKVKTDGIEINVFAETASAVVDVLNHLQDRIKDLDLSRERRYLQRLRQPRRQSSIHLSESMYTDDSMTSSAFFTSVISVSLLNIQVSWIVGNSAGPIAGHENHDLVLSIKLIDLRTKSENSSRITIEDLQLQMVPFSQDKNIRHMNSALLPEVIFTVGYYASEKERNLSFQAAGKSLDLRLEPQFVIPANVLQRSISVAMDKFREASASWKFTPTESGAERKNPFGDKRLASLLVDADFAGAVVQLQPTKRLGRADGTSKPSGRDAQQGRYGQFMGEDPGAGSSLRSPGFAVKVEYKDNGKESSMNADVMISASSNTLTPTIVPLLLELSESIQTAVGDTDRSQPKTSPRAAQNFLSDDSLFTADPSALLGRTSLDLGLRICSQEFSLSCQPIARVAATARIENIYITTNNIRSIEQDHFFAVSAIFEKLQASVQHVYSRESTFSFEMEQIALSAMNSKHLSGTAGISAILKVYPTQTQINARQLQDFLLFREIWYPPEIRPSSRPPETQTTEPQEYFAQKYRQVATATAFPWTATITIQEMSVELDLGQAIGKMTLSISDVWASSRKQSNWEQNLCVGIDKMTVSSAGRTSGIVEMDGFKVRTMIGWPVDDQGYSQTPLIQASAGFDRLRVKAAFDYQAFGIADISTFAFLMYNVKQEAEGSKDRLVAILDGGEVAVFCTATSASQAFALYQAFDRLIQENHVAYAQSLKDIEKFMRRQSATVPPRIEAVSRSTTKPKSENDALQAPISLYTDVVVTLKSINVGAFPSAFTDNQIFLLEASDVQARFAVTLEQGRIHSGLGTTLGQLSVALAAAAHPSGPKRLEEVTVDDVVKGARASKGGTILRVPKVIATMQTWQTPASYHIDYVFKSSFEGKVDVGWNLARINFIRGMWNTHSKTLASRLGRPLPESSVKITTGSESPELDKTKGDGEGEQQEKITAVVNMPQSKYDYTPLEPPIIETPQLRDMGEATPPLEWIGLHRDRLPHVTHQIVIVGLLGVAKEVEDAYGRILGSS